MALYKPEISGGIVQFHVDGLKRRVDGRCASHLGRITNRVGVPVAVGIAVGIEAIREEMVVEIEDGIDPEYAEAGVRLPISEIMWLGVKRLAGGACQNRRIHHIDILRKSHTG
jgi:hypothetical protein